MVYKSTGLHIFALQKYSLVHVEFESKELQVVRRPTDHPRAKLIFMLQVKNRRKTELGHGVAETHPTLCINACMAGLKPSLLSKSRRCKPLNLASPLDRYRLL